MHKCPLTTTGAHTVNQMRLYRRRQLEDRMATGRRHKGGYVFAKPDGSPIHLDLRLGAVVLRPDAEAPSDLGASSEDVERSAIGSYPRPAVRADPASSAVR